MEEITITLSYGGNEQEYICPKDWTIARVLSESAAQGFLPSATNYVVAKEKTEEALINSRTLEENGVQDGEVLNVGIPGKAG